jgi:DnaK suppressor protein
MAYGKTFLKKMRETLLSQKKEIVSAVYQPRDVDTDGDETDSIQANMLIELGNQLNTRNSFKLTRINSALQRIEDKTYGICEECGEQIPEKRLLANPYFMTCVICAEEREAEEKQRKRS